MDNWRSPHLKLTAPLLQEFWQFELLSLAHYPLVSHTKHSLAAFHDPIPNNISTCWHSFVQILPVSQLRLGGRQGRPCCLCAQSADSPKCCSEHNTCFTHIHQQSIHYAFKSGRLLVHMTGAEKSLNANDGQFVTMSVHYVSTLEMYGMLESTFIPAESIQLYMRGKVYAHVLVSLLCQFFLCGAPSCDPHPLHWRSHTVSSGAPPSPSPSPSQDLSHRPLFPLLVPGPRSFLSVPLPLLAQAAGRLGACLRGGRRNRESQHSRVRRGSSDLGLHQDPSTGRPRPSS